MEFWKLALLGIVIGSNNLATALALGAHGQAERRLRICAVFGVFEFAIPLFGLWLGRAASSWVEERAGWLGALLLALMGTWGIVSGIRNRSHDEHYADRVTTWQGLVALAAVLSVDNLVVGFSLGIRKLEPFLVATVIAVFSVVFTWTGMSLGDRARRPQWERPVKIGSGGLLLALGGATYLEWI